MRITIDLESNEFPRLAALLTEPTVFEAAADYERGYVAGARDAVADACNLDTDFLDPLTAEQRRTLFGLFTKVFGRSDKEARHLFTKRLLGYTGPVSWAGADPHCISEGEANWMIEFLRTAAVVFDV